MTPSKKTFSTELQNFHGPVYGTHIIIPLDIAKHFNDNDSKRVICTLNDSHSFHAAIMPGGEKGYFININGEIRKKLKLVEGTKIEVHLTKDTSKYGIHLPEEMEELLMYDVDGEKCFHSLTMGKQRSLLHIIGKPKSSDLRLKKAMIVLDYLKSTAGKLDFKELNEAFKANR